MRDHDGCEEAILAAMRNDRPGKAEFLAARCDLKHGHLIVGDLHERVTTDPPPPEPEAGTETAPPNEAALSEEDA